MKIKLLIIAIAIIFLPCFVHAKECYFKNDNGVVLNEKEYNYIVSRFDEKFPKIMSQEDYNNLIDDEFLNAEVNVVKSDIIMPLASQEYRTSSKSLIITSACGSTNCSMTVKLEWLKSAKVRSYDVIGAYLDGSTLVLNPVTILVDSSGKSTNQTEIYKQTHGFGTSVLLPSKGDDILIYQYYNVTKGGTIYESYQHATSNISLSTSKKYTISLSGYGRVFLFSSDVKDKFDAMNGVKISV